VSTALKEPAGRDSAPPQSVPEASRRVRGADSVSSPASIRSAAWLVALGVTLASAPTVQGQDSTRTASPRGPGSDPFASAQPQGTGVRAERDSSEERMGWSLFIDQDSVLPWLGPWGGDQNYTMGVGIQVTGRWVPSETGPLSALDNVFGLARIRHRLLSGTTVLLPMDVPRNFESHTLTLLNGAFTPRHIELSDPIVDDRPYASILALTGSHTTVDPYGRRALRTDFTVGMLGLRLSERIQTAIHTHRRRQNQRRDPAAVRPYDPEGWPNQVSDGGEPTAKYTATWLQALSESRSHDVVLHAEGSVGYYTNAAVGLIGRLGWLHSDFWTVQSNPNAVVNQGFRDTAQSARAGNSASRVPRRNRDRRKLDAYLHGALRTRFVVFNELLQGGFRHSNVVLDDTQIEHTLRELDAGATLSSRGVGLTLALTRRSPEYNVGNPRTHTWGGVYIVYRSR